MGPGQSHVGEDRPSGPGEDAAQLHHARALGCHSASGDSAFALCRRRVGHHRAPRVRTASARKDVLTDVQEDVCPVTTAVYVDVVTAGRATGPPRGRDCTTHCQQLKKNWQKETSWWGTSTMCTSALLQYASKRKKSV